jgi:antitoxin (DNA-binding transcriptional repressor) of toxin-antitoxin stability system
MTKDVTLQDMQDHFADHIGDVRRGVTLRLIEGDSLVAQVSPAEAAHDKTPDDMIFRPARGSLADFVPPPPIEADIDVVALIREDRDAR